MSDLITLLARFPQYSARKVRRLAKQLDLLRELKNPEADGIEDDLMAYNLHLAAVSSGESVSLVQDMRVELIPSETPGAREPETVRVLLLEDAIKIFNDESYSVDGVMAAFNGASFMASRIDQ